MIENSLGRSKDCMERTCEATFDNKSINDITHNPMRHDYAKHAEVDKHFIEEMLDGRLICTPCASSEGQHANENGQHLQQLEGEC